MVGRPICSGLLWKRSRVVQALIATTISSSGSVSRATVARDRGRRVNALCQPSTSAGGIRTPRARRATPDSRPPGVAAGLGTGTGGTRPARQAASQVVAPMNSTAPAGITSSATVCPGSPCHTPTASPSRPGIRLPRASASAAAATAPSRA